MEMNNQTDSLFNQQNMTELADQALDNQQNMTELSSEDLDNVSGGFYGSWGVWKSVQNNWFVRQSARGVFGGGGWGWY